MSKFIDDFIDQNREEIINKTIELVKIPSEKDLSTAKEGAPFGVEVRNALDYFLNLANDFGFATKNGNGYYGYVEMGKGDKLIGITTHLDVVPKGDGWKYPAYNGEIHDNRIYSRGICDDKGPAMVSLFAMKALLEAEKRGEIEINSRIRLILGCDEESGWRCMEEYKKLEETPDLSFSPDADFPVIFSEKGILHFDLLGENKAEENGLYLKAIKGGSRYNVVANACTAVIGGDKEKLIALSEKVAEKTDFTFVLDNDLRISSKGIGAHGSTPEVGINAISILVKFLAEMNVSGSFIKFYNDLFGTTTDGSLIGIDFKDEVSGALSLNVGMLTLENGKFNLGIDIRYPVTFKKEDVLDKILKAIKPYNVEYVENSHQASLYIPKDHFLVTTLLDVYRDFTGDMTEPLAIGGGTYARAFPNSVAFGVLFPGEPELAHQPNENMKIEHLILDAKIIGEAIWRLCNVENN